jgi:hypothetical protein
MRFHRLFNSFLALHPPGGLRPPERRPPLSQPEGLASGGSPSKVPAPIAIVGDRGASKCHPCARTGTVTYVPDGQNHCGQTNV